MVMEITRINRVQSNPIGPDYRTKLNEEWIEIKNSGLNSQDMVGWKIWHKAQPSEKFLKAYEFKIFDLDSDRTVKIHTGGGIDTATDLYMGRGNFIWNNTGDEAHLDDPDGKTVSKKIVPPTDR